MAISLRTAGSWAYAASGSVTPTLPTHATGDMLLVRVAYKSSAVATCSASTATSGWAKLGEYHSGTTDSGNGTGSVAIAVFWKVATSAAESNPTVTFSQTVTQVGHVALAYQKGAAEQFITPVGDGGGEEVVDASKSITIASHVSVTAGDLVDLFFAVRDDTTILTGPGITQTGVTFGTYSPQPSSPGSDTSGADGTYDGGYRLASSGTSSAAAVVTATFDTNEWAAAWQTRLRVEAAGTSANAGAASATGAANADTAKVEARGTGASAATGAALGATGRPGIRASAGAAASTGAAYADTGKVKASAGQGAVTGASLAGLAALGAMSGAATATGEALAATARPGTRATAGIVTVTAVANPDTAKVAATLSTAGLTGSASAPAASVSATLGHAAATGAGLAATADVTAGTVTFNAIAATATGAAAVAHMNLSASAGYAQGRSA